MKSLSEALDEATLFKLREAGVATMIPAGRWLFHEGDRSESVYLVESGRLKIEKVDSNGGVTMLGLKEPGSLVGEMSVFEHRRRSAGAIALVDSSLLLVGAQVFFGLCRDLPDLSLAVIVQLADRLRDTSGELSQRGKPMSLVAGRLAVLADAAAGDVESSKVEFTLPISQVELAQWAGVSRAAVVKALRQLRELGVLDNRARIVQVFDRARLRELSAAC